MAVQTPWTINKDLLIYKAFYFFYFGALGTINPYLPVYLRQIGLSAFAVGLLVGLRPIIQLASAPFWTVIADKFRKRKSILIMSVMAWLIMTIALVFMEPTQEICELTAKSDSQSVYTNYTKLNTGFFKRSNEEIWHIHVPESKTRNVIKATRIKRNVVAREDALANVVKIGAERPSTLLMAQSDFLDKSNSSPDLHWFRSKNERTADNRKYQRRRRQLGASDINILKGQRYFRNGQGMLKHQQPELVLSVDKKWHKQRNRSSTISDIIPLKMTSKGKYASKNFAKITGAHNLSKNVSYFNYNRENIQKLTEVQQEKPKGTFDPFNMNGKGSNAFSQLNSFFAKSQNTTTSEPNPADDARYYNMNRAETRARKPENITLNSTKFLSKAKQRNFSTQPLKEAKNLNSTNNGSARTKQETGNGLSLDTTEIGKPSKTLKITQKNLFKTNTNEMKRLFVILLILIVAGEVLETPSAPLSDASLLEYLGESRIHYGKQRLWGSLGHGISSFVVGSLLERSRHLICGEEFIDYTTCFCVFTLLMLTTLVITANFKFKYKDVEETNTSVLSTVLTVHYISFLIGACYMGMCHGLLHNFLMWFLEDLGGSKTLMGLTIGSRCSADIIAFFVASQLIEKLGQIKIVFIALISYGTIFIAYSSMTNPWFALAVEFLEGFTYAASWSACTSYLAEAAPQESVTTMQGVLQGVYWGLGTGTGSIMGGHLIHTMGANLTFRVAAAGSFIVASLFAGTQWKWQRTDLDESLGIYHYFSSREPKDTEALLKDDLIGGTSDHRNERTKIKERREKPEKKRSTR